MKAYSIMRVSRLLLSIDRLFRMKWALNRGQGAQPHCHRDPRDSQHCAFNPHKRRKPWNSRQRRGYFRNFNTVITANVFFIPLQLTKTMDPGCKQYSQLDKDLWPLRNSAHHIHRDTVGGGGTKPSFPIYDRGCTPKKRNKEEKKTIQTKKRGIINNLTGEFAFLRPATFKDGRTSLTIQKKLEHFPFTVKRYLSFKHQCTIYSPIFLGQKYSMNYSSGLNWPRRETGLSRWLLLTPRRTDS